ncbi:MAG TPA: hypothetical protein VFN25_00345 [Dokdonella sp.]|uniref:hypothetical protein n=1 Tax=Dokdonella sp. TaxID=2291710 RepID=UPI002D7EA591|nr:hypothetical protein [Dokdonella sp.]HET9031331.1 hypothetical protein [Dokdonella sp.]
MATKLVNIFLLGSCLLTAPVWATTTVLLNANFNDKPLNTSIGTDGPGVGEPSFVHPLIEATVQASPMRTPSLHISKPRGVSLSGVVFDLPGSAAILDGEMRVVFTLRAPDTASTFLFRISEQGSATRNFGRLELDAGGNVTASDASGSSGILRTWAPDETLTIEYLYHLYSRTYDLRINSILHLGNRSHGVTDSAEGIGRLAFETDQNTAWVVDDIVVTQTRAGLFKATLIKWRNRHGIQKVRRSCCVAK